MSLQALQDDPLFAQPRAQRPAYATGMLLDAQDFTDEQTYHRGRLARALGALGGNGTLSGLLVQHVAQTASQAEEVSVQPGLAIDRLGRLIELPRPACLRLVNWYAATLAADGGDTLSTSTYTNLARFVSQRTTDDAVALPTRAVVADVFIRFGACPVGLTPSFAAGPFDALNAVSTSRLSDAYELLLVARTGLSDVYSGLPLPPAAVVLSDEGATEATRRDALQDAVLAPYPGAAPLGPSPEQPPDIDPSAVFVARVFLPVNAANPPVRTADLPVIDNYARRFVPSAALFAQRAAL
jgi:hypothetical protein